MTNGESLVDRFEADRRRLRGMAYRMLGSAAEADDAVQEAWIRLSHADSAAVDNLSGWLTTVVARLCLDTLRARCARREEPSGFQLPDPVVSALETADPEQEELLADAVGVALLVVLDTLAPAERLAFVLHDMFGLSFEQVAPIVGRSPVAARQLASRARRRVRGAHKDPAPDPSRQQRLVEAFLAASRSGDLEALLALLDPEVVLRVDFGKSGRGGSRELRGPRAAAEEAIRGAQRAASTRLVRVNGTVGLLAYDGEGRPFAVLSFTMAQDRIMEVDVLADAARVARLALPT
jgi:RNA polymerase sigma-70 factor (ECF subfamily)